MGFARRSEDASRDLVCKHGIQLPAATTQLCSLMTVCDEREGLSPSFGVGVVSALSRSGRSYMPAQPALKLTPLLGASPARHTRVHIGMSGPSFGVQTL